MYIKQRGTPDGKIIVEVVTDTLEEAEELKNYFHAQHMPVSITSYIDNEGTWLVSVQKNNR